MLTSAKEWISKYIIFLVALALISCLAYLIFRSSALHDPDSYYNIALSDHIKDHGLRYQFRWAQFSTFKDSFADKDLALHIISMPFLYLTNDKVIAGKYASISLMVLFVSAYLFILRRYLRGPMASLFLLLPFTSWISSIYLLELRSVTLANILIILGIYALINRKTLWLLIIAAIYPLTHISFFMLLVFAIMCEVLRYINNREFSKKNIYAVILGSILGCLIHPNFPNNIISLYLNGVLVPYFRLIGLDLGFSGELNPLGMRDVIVSNFSALFTLGAISWISVRMKAKINHSTMVWFGSFAVYLILAFFSMRYWYQADILFFVFAASHVSDLIKKRTAYRTSQKTKIAIAMCLIATLPFLYINAKQFTKYTGYLAERNAGMENVARWMNKNIPEGRTIYHSYWDDSSYFICLNPKNNYINTNDPIYMFYRYPREFSLIDDLSMGRVENPHEALRKIFKAEYGYLRKYEPLYDQVRGDTNHFKVIYEDNEGAIFELSA